MLPNVERSWPRLKSAWVMLVNIALSVVFIAFLFDMWTGTPVVQRLFIQGSQIAITVGLIIGLVLESRHSRKARHLNVSAQLLAGTFLCAVFAFVVWTAKKRGVELDGMEAILVVFGLLTIASGFFSHFLYSRAGRIAVEKSPHH
jgi:Kef-type K+ transport system membrane component KefB